MAYYSFVTNWRLRAPIERVWDAIVRTEEWPQWWPSVVVVRVLQDGDESGVGRVVEYTFKGRLPYLLKFTMATTRVEPPVALEGTASGELVGTGRWRLLQEGDETLATYHWDVSTTKPWMNALAPLLRPLFGWNHDYVMSEGGRGLARWLASGES